MPFPRRPLLPLLAAATGAALFLTGCTQSPAAQRTYDTVPANPTSVTESASSPAEDPALREDIKKSVGEARIRQSVKAAVADAWAQR